jgi:hypothetical protein
MADVLPITRATPNTGELPVGGTDIGPKVPRVEVAVAGERPARPTTVPSSSITVAAGGALPSQSGRIAMARLEGGSTGARTAITPPGIDAGPVADIAPVAHRATVPQPNDGSVDHAARQALGPSTRPSQLDTALAGVSEHAVAQQLLPPHAIDAARAGPAATPTVGVESAKPARAVAGALVRPSAITVDAAVPTSGIARRETLAERSTGEAEPAGFSGERATSITPASTRPAANVPLLPAIVAEVPSAPALHPDLMPTAFATTAPAHLAVSAVGGLLGPPEASAPESAFPRAENVRRQRVATLGGNAASEEAVDHALAYLARQQEPTGRWTIVTDGSPPPGERPPHPHDAACTGLALLTFMARNHSPTAEGPYRDVVTRGLDFLVSVQTDDGDLRGPQEFRGPGSERADLYDHAIATLALGEAAAMSGDRRYSDAALAGAQFIVACQDPRGGGWRYSPRESGDTSVFGWQIMALHSAERLGFNIPDATRALALRYVERARAGERGALGSYRPGQSPTQAMTAELIYARQLLDEPPSDAEVREAAVFFAQPSGSQVDLYCWYYGSLGLVQSGDRELWNVWNPVIRDALVGLQQRGGREDTDGSWDTNFRWASRGGRVFSTALATLTLEVYYRYDAPLPPAAGAKAVTPDSR